MVGDAAGATNVTLLRALLRGDGVVLRASRPHAALDRQLRSMMFGGWVASVPPVAAAVAASMHRSSEAGAAAAAAAAVTASTGKADGSFPNNGLGEVYSTVTIIPAAAAAAAAPAAALLNGGGLLTHSSSSRAALDARSNYAALSPVAPCFRATLITVAEVTVALNLSAADLALDGIAMASAVCNANAAQWVLFDWDLALFRPSTSTPVSRVFDGSADSAFIPLGVSREAYAERPRMLIIAPIINNIVVLGEMGKLIPLSPQRVAYIAPVGSTGVSVGLTGGAGESVTIASCTVDGPSGGCVAASIVTTTCTLSTAGGAVLSLPGGGCS